MWNRIKLQVILAIFWFGSAYLAMGALLPWSWAWRCAWLNLLIGLVSLLLITKNELGDRLFYIDPKEGEEGRLGVAILWAMPAVIFMLAILWWGLRFLGLFDW